MALQKQLAQVDLNQGLDKKTDSKFIIPGKLREATNLALEPGGVIKPRGGTVAAAGGDQVGAPLTTYADELLLAAFTGQRLVTLSGYGAAIYSLPDRGRRYPGQIRNFPVIRNTANQSTFDAISSSNLGQRGYAWEDSRGGVRASVIDDYSGAVHMADQEISATGVLPSATLINGEAAVLYLEGALLRYRTLGVAGLGGATTLRNDADTVSPRMDSHPATHVAYKDNLNQIQLLRYNSAAVLLAGPVALAANPLAGLNIYSNGTNVWVFWCNGSGLQCAIYTVGLVLSVATFVVDAAITTANRIGAVEGPTAGTVHVFYEVPGASAHFADVKRATITSAGAISSAAAIFWRGVGLATKPWLDSTPNAVRVGLVHESVFQPTVFVGEDDSGTARIVARISGGSAGGLHTKTRLPRVATRAVNNVNGISFPFSVLGRLDLFTGIDATRKGISAAFVASTGGNAIDAGSLAVFAGGLQHAYDSVGATELGFHLYPENVTTVGSGTAGSLLAGAYQSCWLYEWVDGAGLVHRSAPSLPVTVTPGAGLSLQHTVPTLRLTDKKAGNGRSEVSLVCFRTEANGTIFYRVQAISSPTANDTTANTVTYNDGLSDTLLIRNEVLYTLGGVLENIAPPAATIVHKHGKRLFLGGLEDPYAFAYSREMRDGEGPAFNELLVDRIPEGAGILTGFGSLDGRLIIFAERGLFGIAGDGPDDTGERSTFTAIQPLPSPAGCVNHASIVLAPMGLLFRSSKGIFLLDRSLNVSFIGAGVEPLTDAASGYTIQSAVHLKDKNQIRFTTNSSGGGTLVFDYERNQWSVFSYFGTGILWRGAYYLGQSNLLYSADSGTTDAGTGITSTMETGWLSMAGIAGFKRVYRALFTGTFNAQSSFTLSVYFDYSEAAAYSVSISATSALYSNGVMQFEHHLRRQVCEAVKFRLVEVTSANYSLQSLKLEVGLKQGRFKLPSTKTFA